MQFVQKRSAIFLPVLLLHGNSKANILKKKQAYIKKTLNNSLVFG
jgi:hypothetical protein